MSEKGEGEVENLNSSQTKCEKTDGPPSPKRQKTIEVSGELKKMSKEALLSKLQDQEKYISQMEDKLKQTSNVGELTSLRESEEKLKLQQQESTRRENVLVMRLATKEQEMQELLTQIHDLKQSQNPAGEQLRSTLLDPAVNIVFQRMKTELDETKEKLEQAQNDLNAWKFTPDSVTGKKLMAKCRMLIQENQELGRQLSQGRVAQLEAELSLQKKYSEELKTSQDELNEFVIQLDEEVEGMQSTILALQQQLKGAKKELAEEKESNEKRVEQIGILKRSLDPVGSQLPTSVESKKMFPRDGDSRRHMTDRTETEFEESGHEPMETDSRERGKENIKTGGIQLEYKASEPQVDGLGMDFNGEKFELDAGGSDIARPSGEHVILDSGDVVPAHENAHCNAESAVIGDSFSKTVAFESARSGMENDTTTSGTSSKYVQNSKLDAECQRTASEDDEEESKSDGLYNKQKRKGLRIIVENPKAITDQAKSNVERTRSSAENTRTGMKQADISTEQRRTVDHSVNTPFDVDPNPLDNGGAFCAPSEPGQRKAAGNVPCPTTFSISQILGEPRRTPSPDIPSGGVDAVVTKIPYIGGYKDSKSESAFRTEGPGYINGGSRDGSPPLVT